MFILVNGIDIAGKPSAECARLMKEADPEAVEERKWTGTPIRSHDGIMSQPSTAALIKKEEDHRQSH